MSLTTDPTDPRLERDQQNPTGQHGTYLILSEDERAKGFVRPVRDSYRHVGQTPKNPLRDLTPDEHERYDQYGYVKFEAYPESESSVVGRFWTTEQLRGSACGTVTTMGRALAETYARDPHFYGATFCVHCNRHLPVAEFVWDGTDEVVGS